MERACPQAYANRYLMNCPQRFSKELDGGLIVFHHKDKLMCGDCQEGTAALPHRAGEFKKVDSK